MQAAVSPESLLPRPAIRKQITLLAWPVIAEQLLTTATNMVDAILVGRLSTEAVAAVGLSQTPHWLMAGLFMGLGVGVNALVARFQGAGETQHIESATRSGFWLGLSLSSLFAVLYYIFAPEILTLVRAEADILPTATAYLQALTPGMVAVYWSMVMSSALRATGDTRTPMLINVGVNIVNVFLSLILIYGYFGAPVMGVLGAGVATSVARILGGVALLAILITRREGARIDLSQIWKIDWSLLKRILNVGSVAASERVFSTFIYIGFAIMVNSLGTRAVAAHTITVVAENVVWMVGSGFSMATAVMVGQRLGARRLDQAEQVVNEAARMCMMVLGALGLTFILFPLPYISIFTNDPATAQLSAQALRIAGFTEIFTALVLVLNGALSGAGDTRPLFFVTTAGGIIRLSLAALMIYIFGWGLQGAWIAASVDWVIRAGLIWLRFRSGTWKSVTV